MDVSSAFSFSLLRSAKDNYLIGFKIVSDKSERAERFCDGLDDDLSRRRAAAEITGNTLVITSLAGDTFSVELAQEDAHDIEALFAHDRKTDCLAVDLSKAPPTSIAIFLKKYRADIVLNRDVVCC